MFKWDGSHLGNHNHNIIKSTLTFNDIYYFHLVINSQETYAIYYRSDSLFPCIVDELKPLFNLIKLGTHSICIDQKQFILIKVPMIDNAIIVEMNMKQLDRKFSHGFIESLRHVLIFRNLLGLSCSMKSIHIRFENEWLPVSFRDFNHRPKRPALKGDIVAKYFSGLPAKNPTYSSYVREYLQVCHGRFLNISLSNWTTKIDSIVKRIDKSYIWISGHVISRMMSYQ